MDNSRTLLTIGHLATTRHSTGNGLWSISGGRGGFPAFGGTKAGSQAGTANGARPGAHSSVGG